MNANQPRVKSKYQSIKRIKREIEEKVDTLYMLRNQWDELSRIDRKTPEGEKLWETILLLRGELKALVWVLSNDNLK
jgi:hypothetical protein